MYRTSQIYHDFLCLDRSLQELNSNKNSSVSSLAGLTTPKTDVSTASGPALCQYERNLQHLHGRKIKTVDLSQYDFRPLACAAAGFTYDYLLNLCMPPDHQPLPVNIIEIITQQNLGYRIKLTKKLEDELNQVELFANQGNERCMSISIESVKMIVCLLGVDISRNLPAVNLEKPQEYLRVKLSRHIEDARCLANVGDREMAVFYNVQAHKIADQLGIDISASQPMISLKKERAFLLDELEKQMKEASGHAANGRRGPRDLAISKAKNIGRQVGEEVFEIPKINWKKEREYLETVLHDAQWYAGRGDKVPLERSLDYARFIAGFLGIDVSQKVDDISMDFHQKFGVIAKIWE